MKLTPTISTPSIATSNRAEVHRTSTNPIMRALKGLSNTFQKWVGSSGQKTHSLQPADKMKIIAIKQDMAARIDNSINEKLELDMAARIDNSINEKLELDMAARIDNSINEQLEKANNTNQLNKLQIQRPKDPPPLPPIQNPSSATSVSSLTVAKKTQVTRPTSPPPPPPIQNPSSATSASSLTVAKKTQVTRPSSPPPPPPPAPPVLDKTNTSQQGPEISAKKESKPVPPSAKDTREMLNNLLHEKPDIYKKLMFALGNRANDQQKNKDSDH